MKTDQLQASNQYRLKMGRRTHLCNLIRQYLREDVQIPSSSTVTDDLILDRLRLPYETDQRNLENAKRRMP